MTDEKVKIGKTLIYYIQSNKKLFFSIVEIVKKMMRPTFNFTLATTGEWLDRILKAMFELKMN